MTTKRSCAWEECGKEFTPVRSTHLYCDPLCAVTARNRKRKYASFDPMDCASCGETFTPDRRNRKFCSPACGEKAKRKGRNPVEESAEPVPEVEYLRQRVNELERERKQAAVGEGWQQELIAHCTTSIEALPSGPSYRPPPAASRKLVHEDAVLLLSDTHLGEVISKEETGGLGEYNFDIFVARMEYLADGVRRYLTETLTGYRFDRLQVFMLGDMVSGVIHEEIQETNELTIVDQVFAGALIFAQMLREWATQFPEVEVTCIVGNHGRTRSKPYAKRKYVNWDWVLYEVLAAYMRDVENVSFDIPKSFLKVKEVRGHKFVLLHGDGIKSQLSIPLYGVNRRAANLAQILGEYSYLVMGHFHELAQMKSWKGERIINGATKGADEYALMMGLASEPVQLMFGVHTENGMTWRLPFNLNNAADKPRRFVYERETPPHLQIPG